MLNWKDDEQYIQCLAMFVTFVGLMFGVCLIAYFGD